MATQGAATQRDAAGWNTKERAWKPNPEEDDPCPICDEIDYPDPDTQSDDDPTLTDDPDTPSGTRRRPPYATKGKGKGKGRDTNGRGEGISNDPNESGYEGRWVEGRWIPTGFQQQDRADVFGFQVMPKKRKPRRFHDNSWKALLSPKLSISDFSIVPKSAPCNTILLIPRGLQIFAKHRNFLERGFPYPKVLQACGITKDEWNGFIHGFTSPMLKHKNRHMQPMMPYELENMLDLVADWDIRFFRPRGYVMRLDMPGEQKFGLDFMDLYHHTTPHKHWDNVEFYARREPGVTMMRPHGERHRWHVRKKGFTHPRIVIDSLEMLINGRAQGRGWTTWIRSCQEAWKTLAEGRGEMDCNEPSHFAKLERRRDRWPASKHMFADRFRGKDTLFYNGAGGQCVRWVPDPESMDLRGGTLIRPKCVVACDEMYYHILKVGGPEDKNHKPYGMVRSPEVRNPVQVKETVRVDASEEQRTAT